MLLYAITQRSIFSGDEPQRATALLAQAHALATGGVDYLQIREKDLPPAALQSLANSIVAVVRSTGSRMKILLNGPPASALEAGCDGIHLSSTASPDVAIAAQRLYQQAGRDCIISAACHTLSEVSARSKYADLLLLAPVFEKIMPEEITPGIGLAALSEAVTAAHGVPVIALGGVTAANAEACLKAGAKGIAAIRLFLNQDWKPLTRA